MANVSLHPAAAADYDDAHAWYGARDKAVADQFEAAVQEAFRTLAQLPEIGAPCDRHHRIWPAGKFPYGLVYRLVSGDVLVVAVKHDRQRPGYWKKRV
jgi:toxin ParE1/3/4